MSLLFEHAVDRFAVGSATLRSLRSGDLEPSGESVPVEPVAEFASHHDALSHPEEDWTCIPLHGPGDATPGDEYVGYTDHAVRGRVFVLEDGDDREVVPADEFGETTLARRMRFWHSDYHPERYPPTYDAPIDDREDPRNPVDPDALLTGFREYVAAEREAIRETNRGRARSRSARGIYERGGDAIPALTCLGEDDPGEYRFRVDLDDRLADRRPDGEWAYFVENEFGVYEDNEVLLHAPGGGDASGEGAATPEDFPVPARVERIRGRNVWLSLDWDAVEATGAVGTALAGEPSGFGVSQLLNPVPFDRRREAVDDLADHPLREVLAGERPITFSNTAAARSDPFDEALNQEQQVAVRYALLADDLFCIHGPPGTGKTRTLVEVVRRAVQAGEDVLVCADSNQAVDNVLVGSSTRDEADPRSLHAHGQHGTGEFDLARVNAKRSSRDLVRRRYGDAAATADVVAATNGSAARLARSFDLVVVDEATQATCTAACTPISLADRVVLAGDHRQLPPFSATEEPPETSYGLSLFEHLYAEGGVFEGVGLQLKTQYRMHRDVAYFPNRAFYDRTLRNGRSVPTLPDRPAVEGFNVGGRVETVDHSHRNPTEAGLVVHLVRELLDDVPAAEVGVITPYAAQASLVRRRLREDLGGSDARDEGGSRPGENADPGAIAVDTVDAFQGGEKTAIVLSLVRSNADGDVGFMGRPADGPRRLNVALTRAKRYCGVVGDLHTYRYERDGKCTDLYQAFYDFFETTGRLSHVDASFLSV